jgi:hypothetical protein
LPPPHTTANAVAVTSPDAVLETMLTEAHDTDPQLYSRRLFSVRAADSLGHRSSASILVNRLYARRGYVSNATPESSRHCITLVAHQHDETIGTMTIGFDNGRGLLADELLSTEIDALRAEDHAVCEFTKLALDSTECSREVLASLFHVAYLYAHRVHGYDRLVIEVNPRHVRYYQRMLGFQVMGPQRMNRRVLAPAVLLCLDFTHTRAQIARFGGRPEAAALERSLYPFSFSASEEAGILARLPRPVWDDGELPPSA